MISNVRELLATIGKNIEVPEFCPQHSESRVDATGFCSECKEEYTWDLSLEEIKKRIERIFLIHRPGPSDNEGEITHCLECGQEFPCSTVQALDGVPEDVS